MKQPFPFLRGSFHRVLKPLRLCLFSGFVFALMLSSHVASAHTLTPTIPLGSVCTGNSCQGGYEAYDFNDTNFDIAWGSFQIPCLPSGNSVFIWVEMGGDTNTVGLAAGVLVSGSSAYLAVDSTGPGGWGLRYGSYIPCGDTATATVSAPNIASVEDTNQSSRYYGRVLQFSGGPAATSIDARCVAQDTNPNANLGNFGTITFNQQCWAHDPISTWQNFGTWGGSYLWVQDNSGNTMAGDPNANRNGLGTDSPEQIQWDAPN